MALCHIPERVFRLESCIDRDQPVTEAARRRTPPGASGGVFYCPGCSGSLLRQPAETEIRHRPERVVRVNFPAISTVFMSLQTVMNADKEVMPSAGRPGGSLDFRPAASRVGCGTRPRVHLKNRTVGVPDGRRRGGKMARSRREARQRRRPRYGAVSNRLIGGEDVLLRQTNRRCLGSRAPACRRSSEGPSAGSKPRRSPFDPERRHQFSWQRALRVSAPGC